MPPPLYLLRDSSEHIVLFIKFHCEASRKEHLDVLSYQGCCRVSINQLNTPGVFEGEIVHRENIGKRADDLMELWNEEHPTDPLTA